MATRALVALAFSAAALTGADRATLAPLRPVADGFFSVQHPADAHAHARTLRVTHRPRRFAYLKFTRIPSGMPRGVLRLYVLRGSSGRIAVHLASTRWSERSRASRAPSYSKTVTTLSKRIRRRGWLTLTVPTSAARAGTIAFALTAVGRSAHIAIASREARTRAPTLGFRLAGGGPGGSLPSPGSSGGAGSPSQPPTYPPPTPFPQRIPPTFFLSPSGSDSNPCTQAAPCRSFDRGYQVAAPGQGVEAAAGSYGDQDIRYDPAKEGASQNVMIEAAPGATVTVGDLDVGPDRGTRGATHLTVMGVVVTGDVSVNGCGAPADGLQCVAASGGNYLQFVNLDVRGPYAFTCFSCDHVDILGGRWGPLVYDNPCVGSAHPEISTAYDSILPGNRKAKRPNHITIDGAIFENFARCTSSDHTECLQTEPSDYLTIRNSIFRRCDTITVHITEDLGDSLSPAGHGESDHVLIENSFFDQATDATSADGKAYYSLRIPNGTNITVRNNSWLDQPLFSSSNGTYHANYRIVGNLGPFDAAYCENSYTTYSHNVFSNTTCGDPSSKTVGTNFGFTDPTVGGSLNLHLLPGSPAINAADPNDYPPTDIDGQPRPQGPAPDAGADERQ